MSKRAEFRNEVKTRIPDDIYDRLQLFKEFNMISSDSEAVAKLLRMALFGVLPAGFEGKER